ncbi:MAG: two-component system sensor histidine kinase/response regulator, partial [Alphaproteobacteria bacterium HGW-Alphaproteobacteria-16]
IVKGRDIGGPPVTAPSRKGFGTTIIERSVPYDLGGEARVRYAAEGFEADFTIPGRHVTIHPAGGVPRIHYPRTAPGHREEPPSDLLRGQDVLLVEDSLIIALDAEDIFARLGADNVTTAASVEAALDLIAASPPTVAMLDINLGNTNSFTIADDLLKRNIPFMFATGYGEQAKFPDQHRGRTVVQKPYTIENIARAMADMLG